MAHPARALLALGCSVVLAMCVSDGGPMDPADGAFAGVMFQPALIESAADASALPVNRIRAITTQAPGGVTLSDTTFVVEPTDASWTLDLRVPLPATTTRAVVMLHLMHVADAVSTIEFSGRTDTLTLVAGQTAAPVAVTLVRGPLANLAVTAVSITSTQLSVVEGQSVLLSADAPTSPPTAGAVVFWTSLDPTVVAIDGATATGVATGVASVVASAGAFADTAALTVLPRVDSVLVSPDSAEVPQGETFAYTVRLFDPAGGELSGRAVDWTTGDGSIATVDAAGLVTAVAQGATTVTATSEGVSDDAVVVVTPAPGGAGPGINEWVAAIDGLWSTAAGWSQGRAPIPGDTVRLTAGASYTVTLDVDASISSLTVGGAEGGTQRLVQTANALTITEDGVVASNGIYELGGGAVVLSGGELLINGLLEWTGGALTGAGTTRTSGTASLILAGGTKSMTAGHTLLLDPGTSHWTAGDIVGDGTGGIVVEAEHSWFIEEAALQLTDVTFTNRGTVIKQAPTDARFGSFMNQSPGRIEIQSGALVLVGEAFIDHSGGSTVSIDAGATLAVDAPGSVTLARSIAVSGPGMIEVRGGSLMMQLDGAFTLPGVAVNGGVFLAPDQAVDVANVLIDGTLTLGSSGTVTLNRFGRLDVSGSVTNAGTIEGMERITAAGPFVNAGVLSPGLSGGVLTIEADVTLEDTSDLLIELGGPEPGEGGHDQLVVSGNLTLGGSLSVSLISGFAPEPGSVFTIVASAALAGAFTSVTLPSAPGLAFSLIESEGDLLVSAASTGGTPRNAWLGATDGDWSDPERWSLGRAPITGDEVDITVDGTYTVTLTDAMAGPSLARLVVGGASGEATLRLTATPPAFSALGVVDEILVAPAGRILVDPFTQLQVVNGVVHNEGVVRVDGGVVEFFVAEGEGAGVTNTGALEIVGSGAMHVYLQDGRTMEQSGTVTASSQAGLSVYDGSLVQTDGTISGGGWLYLSGVAFEMGLDWRTSDASLYLDSSVVTGPGRLLNDAGTVVLHNATLEVEVENDATLLVTGVASLNAGVTTLSSSSYIQVSSDSSGDAVLAVTGDLVNLGLVQLVIGDDTGQRTPRIEPTGAFENAADAPVQVFGVGTGMPAEIRAPFINRGVVTLFSHSLRVGAAGASSINEGPVADLRIGADQTLAVVGSSFVNGDGATISGGAATLDVSGLTGNPGFVNAGIVWPGVPGVAPNLLIVEGPYVQGPTGRLVTEIGDDLLAHGRLVVNGGAALDGTLEIVMLFGFVPPVPSFFDILDATTHTGDFEAIIGQDLVPDLGRGLTLDTAWRAPGELDLVARGQILFHGDPAGDVVGILRSNADASTTVQVTPEFSLTGQGHPRWAPDYQWLTYGGNVSQGNNLLHITHATGSPVFHVVNDVDTRRARFSSDGVNIAFECGQEGAYDHVCTVTNVTSPFDGQGDGDGKTMVTAFTQASGPGVFAWNPQDPNQLAVVRNATTPQGAPTQAIYTVNVDGSGEVLRYTLDAFTEVVGTMDWAPNGSSLAFGTMTQGVGQGIQLLDVQGGILTPLTGAGNLDMHPVWTPDGVAQPELLFLRGLCSASYHAVSIEGQVRQLTADNMCEFEEDQVGHDWSPDGEWIVLTGAASPGQGPSTVYVVPRDVNPTSYISLRRAIRDPGPQNPLDMQPSWRP